jgi:flagellar protein FlbD
MIRLTRINHQPMVLNSDLIEHIEVTPDTVISLITGQKLVVLESADEVIHRVIAFRRAIGFQLASLPRPLPGSPEFEALEESRS